MSTHTWELIEEFGPLGKKLMRVTGSLSGREYIETKIDKVEIFEDDLWKDITEKVDQKEMWKLEIDFEEEFRTAHLQSLFWVGRDTRYA